MKPPYHNLKSDEKARMSQILKELEKLATELAPLLERKNLPGYVVSTDSSYECHIVRK
jgi:hypothetical protein